MSKILLLNDKEFAQFKRGGNEPYQKIFDQYFGLIKFIVTRCGVANGDVADIVQETFFRLHQIRQKIDHQSAIKNWLAITAKNLSIDYLRKHRRLTQLEDKHIENVKDPIQENTLRELEVSLIGDLLEKISLDTNETSALDFYKIGLSAKQIAEKNSEPISSVTNRLSRFRKKFKEKLVEHIEELRATIPD